MPITPIIPGEPGNDLAQLINPRLAEIDTAHGDLRAEDAKIAARYDLAHGHYTELGSQWVSATGTAFNVDQSRCRAQIYNGMIHVSAEITASSAITVGTTGNITNVRVLTIAATVRDMIEAGSIISIRPVEDVAGYSGGAGRLASYTLTPSGGVDLCAVGGSANIPAGEVLSLHASWPLLRGVQKHS